MKNPFLPPHPEKREFNYKPRYYEVDGGLKNETGDLDMNKVAERLHRSWSAKRKKRKPDYQSSFTLLIVLVLIVFILSFFMYKFLL
jgi:hypothetical protein